MCIPGGLRGEAPELHDRRCRAARQRGQAAAVEQATDKRIVTERKSKKLLKKKDADTKELFHKRFGFVQQKIRDDPIVPVTGGSPA